MRDARMGKKHTPIMAGLDRLDQVQANGKKARLIFIHQMPLSQWEPNLTKNFRHYLTLTYKEIIVQMNSNIELNELSSTQS